MIRVDAQLGCRRRAAKPAILAPGTTHPELRGTDMSTTTWTPTAEIVQGGVLVFESFARESADVSDSRLDRALDEGVRELLLNRDATPYLLADGGVLIARLLSALQTLNDERLVRRSQEG